MQTLDIISVNLWQVLISLANLLLIFLIIKKVFYKPVQNVIAKRQEEIDQRYKNADEAEKHALDSKEKYEQKLSCAEEEAESILREATLRADRRGEKIVAEAQEKADGIVRQAEAAALLERKKATEGIKREIVEVSTCLSEKILERELKAEDHRNLIDSFISEIGEGDE